MTAISGVWFEDFIVTRVDESTDLLRISGEQPTEETTVVLKTGSTRGCGLDPF